MTGTAQRVSSDAACYVTALMAGELFADPAYQRDIDVRRVERMAVEFDRRLLGVLEVSDRGGGRYAVLDGQHRHALVLRVLDETAVLVCQVYEGLTPADEARMFHEVNARRKQLSFWDKWKSRRASGDETVEAIEAMLARHELRVQPAAEDGCIAATSALEAIVGLDDGHVGLLEETITLLRLAYGSSRSAFEGAAMQGLALVLRTYGAELVYSRLTEQLSSLPVRQLRARAVALREVQRGTLPRLIAAVIVEQYNRGRGPNLEAFSVRGRMQPATAAAPRVAAATCTCTHSEGTHDDDGLCNRCEDCTGFTKAET